MAMVEQRAARMLDWGIASRPFAGEAASGDAAVVAMSDGVALVAAVDGLGHGAEAAFAAETAAAVLREFAGEEVESLLHRCHRRLEGTRGAAISLASVSAAARTLTWLAVGNVEGRLIRPGVPAAVSSLMLPGGLAGHELPRLVPRSVPLRHGDTLVLATDGVASDFDRALDLGGSGQEVADRILDATARATDDALVVVARYVEDR